VGKLKPVPLLLSLLLSLRNLDIDLNQQAMVQLSPPPLPAPPINSFRTTKRVDPKDTTHIKHQPGRMI
jgi:hypothetical protein